MPHGSDSAADAGGVEELGFCIAGLKQPSASRGETTEAVAKPQRRRSPRESKSSRGASGPADAECGRKRQRGQRCSGRSTASFGAYLCTTGQTAIGSSLWLSSPGRQAAVVAGDRAGKVSGCRSRTIDAPHYSRRRTVEQDFRSGGEQKLDVGLSAVPRLVRGGRRAPLHRP